MLLFALLLALLFADQAVADPMRIMPIGDSITAGYTDNPDWNVDFEFGYRSGLYTRLTNAGYDFQFVGGSTEPFDNAFPGDPTRNGTYTPPIDLRVLGQDGHRGYGGKAGPFFLANGPGWLLEDEPDVILMHVGTNGQQFTTELDSLISHVVATRPEVQILLAEIIPKRNFNANIVTYNSFLRETLLPKYEAMGARVHLVDHYTKFLTNQADPTSINTSYMATGNHPNGVGYDVMAQTWFEGIEDWTSDSDFNLDGEIDGYDLSEPGHGWSERYGSGLGGSNFLDWQREFQGPHRRLVLNVDLNTGDASIENYAPVSYSIDAYTIGSASGSLLTTWDSLEDQLYDGWVEAMPNVGQLSELNPTGNLPLPTGESISLGNIFDVNTGTADLSFQFRDQILGTIDAEVVYVSMSLTAPVSVPEPNSCGMLLLGVCSLAGNRGGILL